MRNSRNGMMLAAAACLAMALAGCAGPGGNDNTAGGSAGAGRQATVGTSDGSGGTSAGAPRALPALGRPPTGDRSVVYTAGLTVRVRDVSSASSRADTIVTGADGYVFSSDTDVDPAGSEARSATVVVKVPPRSFAAVLRSLAGLGTPLDRSQHVDDVTDQVVDVDARVQTQRASVARVRTLLAQARTVGEVVAVESELTKRGADLESLLARQRALDAQVALSTITLRLVAPSVAAATAGPRGFVAGVRAGWRAFVRSVEAGLTVLGAVLPFAFGLGIVLLVVVPARRLLLGRRRSATASR